MMKKKRNPVVIAVIVILVIILCLLLAYFFIKKFSFQNDSSQIANPASVYCEDNGGILDIRSDEQGNQYGICLKNEKECEEWAFYRGECIL
jgi:putative hemolysin